MIGVVENFTQKFGGGVKIDGKFYDWNLETRKYADSLKKGDKVSYETDGKRITFIKLVDAAENLPQKLVVNPLDEIKLLIKEVNTKIDRLLVKAGV